MKKFIFHGQRLLGVLILLGAVSACQEATIDTANLKKKSQEAGGRLSADADASDYDNYGTAAVADNVEYPDIEYKSNFGEARVTKPAKTTSGLHHTFVTSMTKSTFKVKTTYWKADKDEGNKSTNNWKDEALYQTTAGIPQDGATTKDATGTRFMIFATSATTNKGEKITFSKPFPVIVLPATASRYDELKKLGSMQFTATVSGTGSFEIIATVTMMGSSEDSVQISIDYDIPSEPSDKRGIYYQKIPMFKYSEYLVDLKTKNLSSINAKTHAYDEKEKALVDVTLNYDICKRTLKGKVDTFSACQQ